MDTNDTKPQKTLNGVFVGLAVGILALVIIAATIFAVLKLRETPEEKVARLLDVGQQYLMDEKYENAIATYDEVLAIEPKNEKAIEGEVQTYLTWSDALVTEEKYDDASKVLAEATGKFSDVRLQNAEQSVQVVATIGENYEQIREVVTQMAQACEAGDYETASNLLADNDALWQAITDAGGDRLVIADTGVKPAGVYQCGKSYFLYYGDYEGNARKGTGVWLRNYDPAENHEKYVSIIGAWSNDAPNGYQEINDVYSESYLNSLGKGNRVSIKRSGNVINGLFDGVWHEMDSYGATFEYNYQKGKVQILSVWSDNVNNPYEIAREEGGGNASHYASEDTINIVWGIPGYQVKNASLTD